MPPILPAHGVRAVGKHIEFMVYDASVCGTGQKIPVHYGGIVFPTFFRICRRDIKVVEEPKANDTCHDRYGMDRSSFSLIY